MLTKIKEWSLGVLEEGKNAALGIVRKPSLEAFLNFYRINGHEPLGKVIKVLKLELDPKKKTAILHVELAGEDKPVEFSEIRYAQKSPTEIEILAVKCNREWINVLSEVLLPKTIPLPEKASKIINTLT